MSLPPSFPYNAFTWSDAERAQYVESRHYSWPAKRQVEHLRGADGLVHWPRQGDAKVDPWEEADYPETGKRERVLVWLHIQFRRRK